MSVGHTQLAPPRRAGARLLTLAVLIGAGVLAAAGSLGPIAATVTALKIVSPRPAEILSGKQPIEAVVPPPEDGAAPSVVQFDVDGTAVATLRTPPYRTDFDFGTSLQSRVIVARILSGPGAGEWAQVVTRRFEATKVDQVARVDLVTLYVSVRGPDGKYVTTLGRDQFTVFDSNQRQELDYFTVERRPLAAAVVLDTSFSMKGEPVEAVREAATRFVRTLAPEDRVMVVAFSSQVRVLTELTSDREEAVRAIRSVEAAGGTALYDAVYTVADRLSHEDGRKAIILLSDGRDEAENGLEPGSLHIFEEALEKALRSEVILFSIGFGRRLETEKDFYGRVSLKEILDRLAADSGGTSYFPQRTSQLKGAYDLIGEELRNQYSLGYHPRPLRLDGAWHNVRVELKDPALKPLTRRGYYAPSAR